MRALLGLFTVILSLFTFFSTAYADVIDPNNPYHKPPRPPVKPIPVTRVYRMRDPSFILTKVKEKKDAYLLQVTLPGPCEWKYNVYTAKEGKTQKVASGGIYYIQDLKTKSDGREIELQIPDETDKTEFLMAVEFCLYRFQETRYGPKVYDMDTRTESVEHVYELTTADGKQILKEL